MKRSCRIHTSLIYPGTIGSKDGRSLFIITIILGIGIPTDDIRDAYHEESVQPSVSCLQADKANHLSSRLTLFIFLRKHKDR